MYIKEVNWKVATFLKFNFWTEETFKPGFSSLLKLTKKFSAQVAQTLSSWRWRFLHVIGLLNYRDEKITQIMTKWTT